MPKLQASPLEAHNPLCIRIPMDLTWVSLKYRLATVEIGVARFRLGSYGMTMVVARCRRQRHRALLSAPLDKQQAVTSGWGSVFVTPLCKGKEQDVFC